MTNEVLTEHTIYWQARLRLLDWNIDVDFARAYEMDGCLGTCAVNFLRMLATIQVLDPQDLDPEKANGEPDRETERTLVHEMLHVKFAFTDDVLEDRNHDLLEQAIEQLSIAFVAERYGED